MNLLLAQRGMDAASAVGATALAVDDGDPVGEPGVGESAIRRRPPLPGMEAEAGDAKQPAHQRDRVVGLLRRDEPIQAHRVSLSFAKKAAAFFKISRSCSSSSTRRRSSRNSSCSSPVRPSRSPRSI
jgi:hypothetical protein